MVEVRCNNYIEGCPFADDNAHEADSLDDFKHDKCPVLANGGQCAAFDAAIGEDKPSKASPIPSLIKKLTDIRVLMGVGAVALLALLVWLGSMFIGGGGIGGSSCEIDEVSELMELDPKASELEEVGEACLNAGLASGDADKLVAGTSALRMAVQQDSDKAAYILGRVFDPIARPEVEGEAGYPELLPASDVPEALNLYDQAADTLPEAKAAADALRDRFKNYAVTASGSEGGPLELPEHKGLARRVLAKPGAARFASASESGNGTALPPLSIHYVFEAKPGWLRIGYDYEGGAQGWVKDDMVEDWNVMLVFSYAPREFRKRVVFFEDQVAASSILTKPDRGPQIDQLLSSADSNSPDPRVVAVEENAVDARSSPYLMPILKTDRVNLEDGRSVYLAKVASVAGRDILSSGSDPSATGQGRYCDRVNVADAIHQVVFVIDTTTSMGPYINGTKAIAKTWAAEVRRRGIADKFRFGLVGYRNNMDDEPQRSGLEYVTRKPLTLASGSTVDAFSQALDELQPARVSTHSFNEDATAGLDEAVRMDWSQGCGSKMIFLVTDAGALQSDDPKARTQGTGLGTVAALAESKGISIFPVHIRTPEARSARNIELAERQYRRDLADPSGTPLYRPIEDGTAKGFTGYLRQVGVLLDGLEKESRNELVREEDFANSAKSGGETSVSDLVLGKLFAAQQRFVGVAAGVNAPTFTSSWTSDRDIANPDLAAFKVEVLLTRRQLGQLAERCQRLIDNARNTESARFFERLRMVAAATSQDPARFTQADLSLGELMPSFLSLLPYRSDVLNLSQDDWRAMSASKQKEFINGLVQKVSYYRRLDGNQSLWDKLGSSSSGEDVTRIPLDELP